jgi:hypothetical protein
MKRRLSLAILVLVGMTPLVHSATPAYRDGLITSVRKKAHERTLYYLVNTPVMTEDPYYEISVRINGNVYVGEYALRQSEDELPFDWKPGDEVRVLIR